MSKLIALMMAFALLIGCAALAEADAPVGTKIVNAIEDGSYVIRIDVDADDAGEWRADDMAQDDSVLRLAEAGVQDGAFVARYAPTGDGDVSVGVRHFNGIACDRLYTWDLHVEGGAVQDCTGGSATESPLEAELDPLISGAWQSDQANVTISKNAGSGWTAEIAPADGEAFAADILYDCELVALVYDAGDAGSGSFAFTGDSVDSLGLIWYSSEAPDADVTLTRAGGAVIVPMDGGLDLTDGIWPAAFDPQDLKDGALSAHLYTVDGYDIVDIARMAPGDSIVIDGQTVAVEEISQDEDGVHINGGALEGGFDLRAFDEDNCYRVVLDDDLNTCTDHGVASLELDEAVAYTDESDLDGAPVTASGIADVEAAIHADEGTGFDMYNTTLRLEGGRVVEIHRSFVP